MHHMYIIGLVFYVKSIQKFACSRGILSRCNEIANLNIVIFIRLVICSFKEEN